MEIICMLLKRICLFGSENLQLKAKDIKQLKCCKEITNLILIALYICVCVCMCMYTYEHMCANNIVIVSFSILKAIS